MKNVTTIILSISSILLSCSKNNTTQDIIITNDINMESRPLNFDVSRRESNAHNGSYYSSVDSVNQYGIGYEYILDDSLKSKNITVYVSCWVRESQEPIQGEVNVGLSNSTGIIQWHGISIKNKNYKPGEWEKITDTIFYPKDVLNDKIIKIGVVAIKSKGSDTFDVDDLQIKYRFSN